jgi:hypothetical protein
VLIKHFMSHTKEKSRDMCCSQRHTKSDVFFLINCPHDYKQAFCIKIFNMLWAFYRKRKLCSKIWNLRNAICPPYDTLVAELWFFVEFFYYCLFRIYMGHHLHLKKSQPHLFFPWILPVPAASGCCKQPASCCCRLPAAAACTAPYVAVVAVLQGPGSKLRLSSLNRMICYDTVTVARTSGSFPRGAAA